MKKTLVFSLGLFILLGALLACGEASTANTGTQVGNTNTSSSSSATQAPAKHFHIGDAVSVGSTWQITVESVKTADTIDGGITQPKSGNTFVMLTVSMKNISSQEQNVSSLVQFNLIGSDGTKYTETINTDVPNPPDGKVEAGSPSKGTFTYEVPATVKKFTFTFENDMLSSGLTSWDISL